MGVDLNLLDERADELSCLGELAAAQKLARVGGEGLDGLCSIQKPPPLGHPSASKRRAPYQYWNVGMRGQGRGRESYTPRKEV